jgi:hypothetical protein
MDRCVRKSRKIDHEVRVVPEATTGRHQVGENTGNARAMRAEVEPARAKFAGCSSLAPCGPNNACTSVHVCRTYENRNERRKTIACREAASGHGVIGQGRRGERPGDIWGASGGNRCGALFGVKGVFQ